MRRLLLIAALCFLAVATTGCKKAQLRRQLKELMGSTIVLPEKISCVYNGEVYPMPDSLRDKAKLIIYIDSTECTTCRISHFWMYRQIQELSEETGAFELMLLLADTSFESIPLTRYLSDLDMAMPVYVDMDRSFYRENSTVPKGDRRMHSFLIDRTNRPVYVGDPSQSGALFSSFKKVLKQVTIS